MRCQEVMLRTGPPCWSRRRNHCRRSQPTMRLRSQWSGRKGDAGCCGRQCGRRLYRWMAHRAAQVLNVRSLITDWLAPFRRRNDASSAHLSLGLMSECGWGIRHMNKFNTRCVKARLLGFCLRSSRCIVVDCDGRFHCVRTVKRTSPEKVEDRVAETFFLGWRPGGDAR